MFCENCGSQIPEGSAVCPSCGTAARVDLAAAAQPIAPAQPVAPAEPVVPVVPVAPVQPEQPVVPVAPVYQQQPVQPVYQQPAYQQAVYQQPAATGSKGPAITALVLGISGLVFCWIPFLGVLISVAGLILGIISLKNPNGKGMGLTGFILSIVGIQVCQ